jgi:FkbM family methyltransferase
MIVAFVGEIMRKHFPQLYNTINQVIFRIKKNDYVFISDHFGASFKDYISENYTTEKLAKLKLGLDEYSIKTIDIVFSRILNYPESKYKQPFSANKKNIIGGLLNEESIKFNPYQIKRKYKLKLKTSLIESSVFEFYHGLTFLPKKVQNLVRGKDFIDIGAYVGDSAIALRKYDYKKNYSIEMSLQSISDYRKNMLSNGIYDNMFEIINCAVSSKEGLPTIKVKDNGSAGLSLNNNKPTKASEIEVELKTLDTIISEYNIKPAFIKIDIEGMGKDCIAGGLKSLKVFRPVISIAIYHNPIEFFEIKPMLELELSDYSFMIRKLSNSITNNSCHAETILLAYPNEIK